MKIYILIILLFLSAHSFAQKKTMPQRNTFYFQALLGASVLAENKDAPEESGGKAKNSSSGTAYSGAIGYKWEYFSVEVVGAHLGRMENNYDNYYKEQVTASFIGGGLHWTWMFFDLKLGWGSVSDKSIFKKGSQATSFSATPNEKTTSATGGYFGLGFNFNLSPKTEFLIDYTGYAWDRKKQAFNLNGTDHEAVPYSNGVGVLSLGFRWFL